LNVPGHPSTVDPKKHERLLLGACCVAITTLIPVSLYQIGFVDSLPDPPLSVFDSERITTSSASHPFGIPDGILGLASFGMTLALILVAKKSPVATKLLGAKLIMDVSAAAFNGGRQVIQFRKLCSWCTATAAAAGVMAYAGRGLIGETAAAGREILKTSIDASPSGLSNGAAHL
jgi:uncharacterized membrane protein